MYNNYDDNVTVQYDIKFNSAMQNGLCWFPWIGKYYDQQKIKLLVVGESHYASQKNKTDAQQLCDIDRIEKDENFTRKVIYESRICCWWSTATLDNINRALVGRNDFEGKAVWSKIAFYNFIQRPMKTAAERPSWEEFANGWRNFIDVVKIIKPTVCIFIGNSAANFFNEAMSTLNIQHANVTRTKYVNNAWAKESAITIDDVSLPIHSIRHAGRFFSWNDWFNYLRERIPNTISFLQQQLDEPSSDENTLSQNNPEDVINENTKDIPT